MTNGPGDTISVAADTLNLPVRQTEFSIGRIIPLISPAEDFAVEEKSVTALTADYISGLKRVDGMPRPPGPVNSDMSFIILSLSLLLITILTVFGRRSIITGLSSISFRRHEETIPVGTSEVFSWPPVLRNIFTILNVSLFASTALLVTGLADRVQRPVGRGSATVAHRDHRLSRWLTRVLSRFRASESQIGFPKVFALPIYDQTARSPFCRRARFSGRSYHGCGTAKSILVTS